MNLADFAEGNYKPRVRIFRPDQLRVRIDTLTMADLRYLLPNLSEKMHYQLGRAYTFAQRSAKNGHYTLEQLLYAVRQTREGKKGDENGFDEEDPTTGALIWRLHARWATAASSTISRTWNWTNSSSRASVRSSSSTRSTAASSR